MMVPRDILLVVGAGDHVDREADLRAIVDGAVKSRRQGGRRLMFDDWSFAREPKYK